MSDPLCSDTSKVEGEQASSHPARYAVTQASRRREAQDGLVPGSLDRREERQKQMRQWQQEIYIDSDDGGRIRAPLQHAYPRCMQNVFLLCLSLSLLPRASDSLAPGPLERVCPGACQQSSHAPCTRIWSCPRI